MSYFDFPTSFGKAEVKIFTAAKADVNTVSFQPWVKSPGKTMLMVYLLGGGAGGGGGFSAAAASARGGGGGGGSGGSAGLIMPLYCVPQILYAVVGNGGVGGAAGANGVLGGTSSISINTFGGNLASNLFLRSDTTAVGPGIGGTGAGGGAGGSGATAATVSLCTLSGLGVRTFFAGQNGAAGGTGNAPGGAIAIPVTGISAQGGSGGAGTTSADQTGGAFTSIANAWLSEQRPATPAAGSNNGSGGPQLWKQFFSFGGGGGSSSNTGVGGHGGMGAYGSGGGGGGGGTTGGTGGMGGSGLIIFISW